MKGKICVYQLENGMVILGFQDDRRKNVIIEPRKLETKENKVELYALISEPQEIMLEMGFFWYELTQKDFCDLYLSTIPKKNKKSSIVLPSGIIQ